MHQEDCDIVEAIVKNFYGEDYDTQLPQPNKDAALFHIKMYGAAEMYQIYGLKEIALIHVKIYFPKAMESGEYAECISTAYRNTAEKDRALRDFIVKETVQDMESFAETEQLSAALDQAPSFGKDLAYALHARHKSQLKYMDTCIKDRLSWCSCNRRLPAGGVRGILKDWQ
ncbi:hypothetical protein IWX90DRAFT_410405 [Phyllosticta citrichinensis]|uniref:Uncharacterized protein n=1 Tax=Phyllosticta citrichinensis TaxID=1130410 RepID=A0ABR1Y4V9_9PEZI